MTREEKLEAIAERLKEGETIIVSVRHKGKFDGCHCYSLTKNKIVNTLFIYDRNKLAKSGRIF